MAYFRVVNVFCLTHIVKLVVEAAGIAHRLAVSVSSPERGRARPAVAAARALALGARLKLVPFYFIAFNVTGDHCKGEYSAMESEMYFEPQIAGGIRGNLSFERTNGRIFFFRS